YPGALPGGARVQPPALSGQAALRPLHGQPGGISDELPLRPSRAGARPGRARRLVRTSGGPARGLGRDPGGAPPRPPAAGVPAGPAWRHASAARDLSGLTVRDRPAALPPESEPARVHL